MKYVSSICLMLALSVTAYGQQPGTPVVVHVQIVEISLTKLQRLGYSLEKIAGDPNAKSNIDASGNAQPFSVIKDGDEAKHFLEALRKDNLVKVLADPTMIVLPEQRCSVTIDPQYEITMKVKSEASDDKIQLTLRGRRVKLDDEHKAQIDDETMSDLSAREFDTHVELKSGQTLAIRGLTKSRVEVQNRGLPYVSEIPYVGAIFRRVKEERNDIAMLILVRPEIAQSSAIASQPATTGP